MGNKIASPFPSYETAKSHFNSNDLNRLKDNFRKISRDNPVATFVNFAQIPVLCSQYTRKYILQKLFTVLDNKKDGIIDFEEYLCTIALFRLGSPEDKLRFLFLMYEPLKGAILTRDQIRQILVDAMIYSQKEDISVQKLDEWIADLREITECMVETALYQYAAQEGKMDFSEFVTFIQMESSVQEYLKGLSQILDF